MQRPLFQLVIAAVLAVALAAPASADTRHVHDSNDVGGFLDIQSVRHAHTDSGRLRHKVTTFGEWGSRRLRRDCASLALVFRQYDTPHRAVEIFYRNGLKAQMVDYRHDEPRVVGKVKVWRPNRHSVAVSFPKRLLNLSASTYRWQALTETYKGGCPTNHGDPKIFRDFSPNDTYVRHRL